MIEWSYVPLAAVLDWLVTPLAASSPADLLRLATVPVFGWAAYRDVRTRRIPNEAWLPLAVLGIAVLVWEAWRVSTGEAAGVFDALDRERYFLRVALSLGMVATIGYLFYWIGGFGGADAKALIVLAVVFPTYPTYYLPDVALPLTVTTVGVFSLTILSNTVLAGAVYPLAVTARNALGGHVSRAMFVGKPIRAAGATDAYGTLLETSDGTTRRGLDLDALRMYLQWRGCTLADLRDDPDRYRDPASLPEEPNPPGDGTVPSGEGSAASEANSGPAAPGGVGDDSGATDGSDGDFDGPATDGGRDGVSDDSATDGGRDGDSGDPWGAEAFLDDIEGSAYGTTAEGLRGGLEVLVARESVWISPGTPFLVPMFVGLLVSLTCGDLFVELVAALT